MNRILTQRLALLHPLKTDEHSAELKRHSREIQTLHTIIDQQAERIDQQASQLTTQSKRIDELSSRLTEQSKEIEDLKSLNGWCYKSSIQLRSSDLSLLDEKDRQLSGNTHFFHH